MKGYAQMADLALAYEILRLFVGAAFFIMAVIPRMLGMHQVKIEIFHAAGGELAVEQGRDVLGGTEIVFAQFVG